MDARAAIGLDWGTSSLRAYLFDRSGRVVDRREEARGIQSIVDGRFREAFESLCAEWLTDGAGLPVIACGMIGSRQGWHEAPYLPTPAGFAELAANLASIDGIAGRRFRIIPGVSTVSPEGTHDVIRGEETQVFGALASLGVDDAIVVLPGTHSKWVRVRDRRIVAFRTYMTGELYAVLARHSILGRLFPPADAQNAHGADDTAFKDGLERAAADPGGITALLFSVRAEGLFERYRAPALPAYLSGLLIGAEVAHASAGLAGGDRFSGSIAAGTAPDSDDIGTDARPGAHDDARPLIAIAGSEELVRRYSIALAHGGLDAVPVPGVPAADGLFAIARAAGLAD
jgi:2-dehydro-3-deoxygalactonokinase